MKVRIYVPILGFLFGSGCGISSSKPQTESDLGQCNLIEIEMPAVNPFKSAQYVRVATQLQSMGKEKACERLAELAERGDDDGQVAFLCRLLFVKKANVSFRPPFFGVPNYMGGTNSEDWPLSPLELVDDVPFRVARSYNIAGEPEASRTYLDFCLKNCNWCDRQFEKVNDQAIKKALNSLLNSEKWRKPLTNSERKYLGSQIEQ